MFTSTQLTKTCQGCEGPNNLFLKWQYRDTAPTNTPTGIKKQSEILNEPKIHDNDKTCFVFRTACPCPNSCADEDDRQRYTTAGDLVVRCFLVLASVLPLSLSQQSSAFGAVV